MAHPVGVTFCFVCLQNGQLLPGAKGLSMTRDQWNKLVEGMEKLNAKLAQMS